MTSCTFDRHWSPLALACPPALRPWLHHRASLTRRIQQHCGHFAVRPVANGRARIAPDEADLIGLPADRLAYARDVFLYADGQPVVFAHSTVAPVHLRGAWSALGKLGTRPLGALLFSHPHIRRHALHYQYLSPHHPLYRRAVRDLPNPPPGLWARRSLFWLKHAPLLVTEVFLPGMVNLRGPLPL